MQPLSLSQIDRLVDELNAFSHPTIEVRIDKRTDHGHAVEIFGDLLDKRSGGVIGDISRDLVWQFDQVTHRGLHLDPSAQRQRFTGYHQDAVGDWVAELECGHNQHLRHRPPFQLRAWVLDLEGRAARLGTTLECPLCERAEMPDALRWVRTTPIWDQDTMPAGLRRAHRIAAGTWGRIVVLEGRLRFAAAIEIERGAGVTQVIPPGVEHEVEPLGAVRFAVEFFAVDRGGQPHEPREATDEGGDPACWAGLVCPECGAITEGGLHRAGCPAAGATR